MTHKVIAVRPPEPRTPDLKREMFKGFMETVLLSVIARHGPVYGYDIVRIVRESSQGFFALNAGSLYPSLARLMQRGWTDVKPAASPRGGAPVWLYAITEAGRVELARRRALQAEFHAALGRVLNG